MKTNRREFLKTLLAGTAAAMVPKSLVDAAAPEAPEPQPVTGDEVRAAHVPEWDAVPEAVPGPVRQECPYDGTCCCYFRCPPDITDCWYYKDHIAEDAAVTDDTPSADNDVFRGLDEYGIFSGHDR